MPTTRSWLSITKMPRVADSPATLNMSCYTTIGVSSKHRRLNHSRYIPILSNSPMVHSVR